MGGGVYVLLRGCYKISVEKLLGWFYLFSLGEIWSKYKSICKHRSKCNFMGWTCTHNKSNHRIIVLFGTREFLKYL